MEPSAGSIVWLSDASMADAAALGGKAANLGALIAAGFPVPPGFVLTADAYRRAMDANGLTAALRYGIEATDPDDGGPPSAGPGEIRERIVAAGMPDELRAEVLRAYEELVGPEGVAPGARVAVRSSAVGEDGSSASHAGIHDSFTDIDDGEDLIARIVGCWASAHGDRALAYRASKDVGSDVAMAVVVQAMVDSTRSGVVFSLDPTGTRDVTLVEAALGPGKVVVEGLVDPDTYAVRRDRPEVASERIGHQAFRIESSPEGDRRVELDAETAAAPVLTHDEVLALADVARRIEDHHGTAQDIEFTLDPGGSLHIIQSRPITTLGDRGAGTATSSSGGAGHHGEDGERSVLVEGLAASPGSAVGRVRILSEPGDSHRLERGEVLVTSTTGPDWVPAFLVAAAVVTDHGGITSHAAIVSRELGLPAVVGTRTATVDLHDGQLVRVDGSTGEVTEAGGGEGTGPADTSVASTVPSPAPATGPTGSAADR